MRSDVAKQKQENRGPQNEGDDIEPRIRVSVSCSFRHVHNGQHDPCLR